LVTRNDSQPVFSLAFRLTVSYAVATALLLALLGAGMYLLVAYEFRRDDTRFMDDTVSLLQTILADRDDILQVLHRELPRDLEAFHFNRYQLRLQDLQGEVLYTSPAFPISLNLTSLPVYPEGENGQVTLFSEAESGRQYLVLAASARLGRSRPRPVVLHVAVDNSSNQQTLRTYRNALVVVFVAGTLAAVLLSGLIARRGLRPLRSMTGTIQRIRFLGLTQRGRVSQSGWPSELTGLSQAFDQLLDELEQGVERLSHFSTDLAHEFRTPLTNISLQAELLLQAARSPADYQAGLNSVLEEIERLSTLVERLLFLARMENPEELDLQLLSARSVVERMVDFYSASAAEHGVQMEVSGEARVEADQTLFEAALGNLLSNALRYTPEGGRIVVSLEEAGGYARISVTDTGQGISPEHLPFLLDRFYRADRSRSLDGKGFGLGLALVKSIMSVHQGEVKISSQLGRGTTVSLHYPYRTVI